MKYFIVFLAVLFGFLKCDGQDGYYREYRSLEGLNFYDLTIAGDSLFLLQGYLYEDPVSIGQNKILLIHGDNGNAIGSIALDIAYSEIPFRLNFDIDDGIIYLFMFNFVLNESDSIMILSYNFKNKEMNKTSIAFPGDILTSAWSVEQDSILILSYVHSQIENIKFIKVAKQDLGHDGDLKSGPDMSAPLDLQQRHGYQNKYIARNFGRVYNWDLSTGEAAVILFDTVRSHGHVIPSIDNKGYALFGLGQDIDSGLGYQFTVVVIDSNLNFQNRVLFGEGSTSFDYAALTSSIDHDTKHYFVAGHINMSLLPYTSTVPKSFYVGKFDENLNESWLHILGGDKHYFISGVKADGYGGCYVYGFTRPPEFNFEAIPFLMRLNADGLITSSEHTQPDQYHITIYGNPGQDAFRFGFMSGTEGYRIRLIDLQGRIVADTEVTGGTQEIQMMGQSAGAYIWQLYHPQGSLLDSGKWMKVE